MLLKLFLVLIFVLTLSGCKDDPPNPTPELLDPIYLDLVSKRDAAVGFVSVSEKSLELTYSEWRTATVASGSKKRKRGRYFKEQKDLWKIRQEVKYYELAILSRIIEARKSYIKAYKNKQPWPDPEEFAKYKRINELKNISRRWDDRIPKLHHRVEEYEKSRLPAKKK